MRAELRSPWTRAVLLGLVVIVVMIVVVAGGDDEIRARLLALNLEREPA